MRIFPGCEDRLLFNAISDLDDEEIPSIETLMGFVSENDIGRAGVDSNRKFKSGIASFINWLLETLDIVTMDKKPWEDVWVKIWNFLTRGRRGYLTIPIFVIVVVYLVVVAGVEKGLKGAYLVADFFSEKTSYLTKEELEIHNEWVILLDYADNKAAAEESRKKFLAYYKQAGEIVWKYNVLVVRDIDSEGRWLVVIDTFPKRSCKKIIQAEINRINSVANNGEREIQDTLGMWIFASKPLDYRLDKFEETYGRVVNLPEVLRKRAIDSPTCL